ncbi:DUF2591 domain-containing protein [Burkholderia sp. LS-044]|uniref:phage protein NinX family protein n=1 Tax=Burkholderia TaxID=32008 RepID=UPI0010A692F6|nr:phage protein NinX family protein [Burkholderia sp. LS-044]THJ52596.1 DUF2591 domain-containing protein [Burkholderia sp. LS-044]
MKISELTGGELDYWVALADLEQGYMHGHMTMRAKRNIAGELMVHFGSDDLGWDFWHPSSSWAQGGAIIERERIILKPFEDGMWGAAYEFDADARGGMFYIHRSQEATTPLIAAMRAYVASKFGDEVQDAAA